MIADDLGAEFGDKIAVSFDFSDVPALKEGEDAKWGRANEGLARGYVTVNEAREIVGLEAIGEPGDVLIPTVTEGNDASEPLGALALAGAMIKLGASGSCGNEDSGTTASVGTLLV